MHKASSDEYVHEYNETAYVLNLIDTERNDWNANA